MKKIATITIIIFFGLLIYFGFKCANKIKDTANEKTTTLNYDKNMVNVFLTDNLSSKGISYNVLDDLEIIFDLDNSIEDSLIINKKTYYINYQKNELSLKKYSNSQINNSYYVYKFKNYYLLVQVSSNGEFNFKLYDENIEEVFADMCEGEIAFTDEYIYYTTYGDDSKKEVYRLNLSTMYSSLDFYLDNKKS